jgi:hypothetical protein
LKYKSALFLQWVTSSGETGSLAGDELWMVPFEVPFKPHGHVSPVPSILPDNVSGTSMVSSFHRFGSACVYNPICKDSVGSTVIFYKIMVLIDRNLSTYIIGGNGENGTEAKDKKMVDSLGRSGDSDRGGMETKCRIDPGGRPSDGIVDDSF